MDLSHSINRIIEEPKVWWYFVFLLDGDSYPSDSFDYYPCDPAVGFGLLAGCKQEAT